MVLSRGRDMAEKTMTLNLSEREMAVLDGLAAESEMSKTAVMRQALRLYQLVRVRAKAGERVFFEGDDRRRAEFIGPWLDADAAQTPNGR